MGQGAGQSLPCVCQNECGEARIESAVSEEYTEGNGRNAKVVSEEAAGRAMEGSRMVESAPTIQASDDRAKSSGVNPVLRFDVALSKDSGNSSFGLAHAPMQDGSGVLLVVELREGGIVARWNAEQARAGKPEWVIKSADRIVQVGGSSDIDIMRAHFREDRVQFTVERWPEIIIASLKKRCAGDKYGMQTDLVMMEDGVEVLRVGQLSTGGLLEEWNRGAIMSRRHHEIVHPGSEIVKVGDLSGSPRRLQQTLLAGSGADISFKRPDRGLFS